MRLAQSVLCAHGLDLAVDVVPVVDVDGGGTVVVDVSCVRMGLVAEIGASTGGG